MSLLRKTLLTSLTLIVIAFASTVARADTVVLNESFTGVAGGVYFSGTTVGQFTVQSGAVEVLDATRINQGPRCATAGGSPTCISLGVDAESTSTGSTFVSTNFFAPGTYDLFFDIAGSQEGDFNQGDTNTTFLFFGNIINSPITLAPDAKFSTRSFLNVAVAPGASSRIVFFQPTDLGNNEGNLLDNVRLVRRDNAATVPEPATMTLLITGLAGVAAKVRRRRNLKENKQL